ncbi:uncharacterized protein LOC129348969 [Amphiprion ocellaris]|uniref:uncharacterized protein LOC129348969 n=1 Tax=Amphiprion ocellaris TaxID=80972 RepID=UPI00241112EF|nr:uncharacterized protein LOC129348969 [Amphiprion ocellaris]
MDAEFLRLLDSIRGGEKIHTFRFLGVHISDDLSWTDNITAVIKKAQQQLHFLRVLRKNNLDRKLLLAFYSSSIENLLTFCVSTWYRKLLLTFYSSSTENLLTFCVSTWYRKLLLTFYSSSTENLLTFCVSTWYRKLLLTFYSSSIENLLTFCVSTWYRKLLLTFYSSSTENLLTFCVSTWYRKLLLTFYSSSTENLLTFCVSTWYRSCTEADRARLQRIVGCPLPSLMDIYSTRCLSRAQNIIEDSSHPGK